MQRFALSRHPENRTLNDKKINSNSKDRVSCGSLQTDLEFEIDGTRFKFNNDLTASILHFYHKKFNMVENKSVKVQLIALSSSMLDEFILSRKDCCMNYSWYDENVLQLWDAARVLNVPSLIRSCEAKVGQIFSGDNFERIYTKAHLYKSDIVLYKARTFLDSFFRYQMKESRLMNDCESGVIHVLTCVLTYEDFLYLIKAWPFRPEKSNDILKSIFEWAENYDNRDKSLRTKNDELDMPQKTRDYNLDKSSQKIRDYDKDVSCKKDDKFENKSSILFTLLKASKYRSASVECLQELSRHGMCQRDQETKLLINEAISCKLDRNTHGYWFPSQIYKNLFNYRHIGVLADKDRVSIMYPEPSPYHNWNRLHRCPLHSTITNLTVFDNELYAISSTGLESLIFVFRNEEWKFVVDLPNTGFVVVSKGEFIYVIDGTSSSVKCVSPRETPVLHSEIKFPDMMSNPESALDFDKSILIFCSTDSDERSAVISLDVPEHKWTDCGHLQGSAKNLVGFRNETNYFILQSDGSISQVLRKQDDCIEFIFIKRLWSIQSSLRGAFIYSDELYIFSNTPVESPCLPGVSGVFSKIQYWYQEKEACSFVHFIMPYQYIERSEHLFEPESESDNE